MTLNERIVDLCNKHNISQSRLEKELGIALGSITKWKTSEPRFSTLEKVATYFGVTVDYLRNGETETQGIPYYLNDDAREMAQFLYENPDYKVLFDASRKVSKKDLDTVKAIIDKFKDPNLD